MSQKLKAVLSVLVILVLLFGLYATFVGIGTNEDGEPLNGKNALKYGLDINGGVYVVMEGKTEGLGYSSEEINEIMDQTRAVLNNRVNQLGVAESTVTREGTNRLRVEMPGVTDAEEAIKLVRRNAQEWHIKPDDIGIMGFSAGGHLASTIATHAPGHAAPNFQILFYPVVSMEQGITHQGSRDNLLGQKPKRKLVNEYCNEQHIKKHTPRAFIALAGDDRSVPPMNSLNYYEELLVNKVPATMHIYPTGGHGFGIRQSFRYHFEMMLELKAWLNSF